MKSKRAEGKSNCYYFIAYTLSSGHTPFGQFRRSSNYIYCPMVLQYYVSMEYNICVRLFTLLVGLRGISLVHAVPMDLSQLNIPLLYQFGSLVEDSVPCGQIGSRRVQKAFSPNQPKRCASPRVKNQETVNQYALSSCDLDTSHAFLVQKRR
jgi:hypothetical protein